MDVSPPDLKIVSFSLGPFSPGDEVIENPYTGKRSVYRKAPGSWQGTVRFGTLDPVTEEYEKNRRKLIKFHSLINGFNNSVKLILPSDYQNTQDIPVNADFSVSSINGEVLTLSKTNQGTFQPAEGDFLNIEDRLFMIRSVSGFDIKIIPNATAFLSDGDDVTFSNIFVKAVFDGTVPLSRTGNQVINHTYSFWEDLL